MKKLLPFLFTIVLAATAYAANVKTGDLPDLSPGQPTDRLMITRGLGATATTGNVTASTLPSITPPGNPGNFIINNGLGGQAAINPLTSGISPNKWTAYYAFGDIVTIGAQKMQVQEAYPYLMGAYMGLGPTPFATSSFGNFQCDIIDQEIFPNFNPSVSGNPLMTLLPSYGDPGYNGPSLDVAHEQITQSCRQAGETWLTVPKQNKVYAQSSNCTKTGSWFNSSKYGGFLGVTSNTHGDNVSCSITTNGQPIFAWYQLHGNDGGSFTWQLDGGAVSANVPTQGPNNNFTFPLSGAFSVGLITIPAPAGTHAVNFAISSTTTVGNTATIYGLGTPQGGPYVTSPALYVGGQLRAFGDLSAANTLAYDNDIKTDVTILSGYGLPISRVDVRNPVCCNTTTDIFSASIFPTPVGQTHLSDAFLGAIQPQRNSLNALNPKDYGASCNAVLFSPSFAGAIVRNVHTTANSPVITVVNGGGGGSYIWKDGIATQNGGGDIGKKICIWQGGGFADVGPCTYVLSVDTVGNTATLGANMIASGGFGFAVMGGYPTNPNDPSTAQDDTPYIQAALTASNSLAPFNNSLPWSQGNAIGGGQVFLPPNCMVHELVPPSNTKLIGNNAGVQYGSLQPGMTATPLYCATNTLADDSQHCINTTNVANFELKDVEMIMPAFPGIFKSSTATCIGGSNFGGPEGLLLDHDSFMFCPVEVGSPFGLNQPVNFTASISGKVMTVSSIDSTNFATNYLVPFSPGTTGGGALAGSTDWLALGRTISGPGVTTGTTITSMSNNALGMTGTYGLSLSQTVTSESMVSPIKDGFFVMSVYSRYNWYGQGGIGVNGDFSDSIWDGDTFTGAGEFNDGFHLGPSTANTGASANRLNNIRFEENVCGMAFDGSAAILTGTQFQFNDSCAIRTLGSGTSVSMTGNWLDGNGGANSSGNRSHILLGGTNPSVSLVGTAIEKGCASSTCGFNNSQYLFQTLTGATPNFVTLEGSGDVFNGFDLAVENFAAGTAPSHYKREAPGINTIDTTQPITISGITITGAKGGANYRTGTASGAVGPGTINVTGLAPVINHVKCSGGDNTTGTSFGLGVTTSTSAALSVTSTVASSDAVWISCPNGN